VESRCFQAIQLQQEDPQAPPGMIVPHHHLVNEKVRAVTEQELRREDREFIDRDYVRRQAINARLKCISDKTTA
jgi:hypothetical protein